MKYKYEVISMHPNVGGCNLQCPFCYKDHKNSKDNKPREWWIELVKHCKTLAPQIALGADGEPFMDIEFVKNMSKECQKHDIILNVTSNGKILEELSDKELKEALEGITMISISFDHYKRPDANELSKYAVLVSRIKHLTKTQVGCNLLIDEDMFKDKGETFLRLCVLMFDIIKVHRIFALTPKNIVCPDILKYKAVYYALTKKYEHFYLDDLGKQIISENKYKDWINKCHYGKALLSINEKGIVQGCSFDSDGIKLDKPEEIKQTFEFGERHNCPYLKR